MVLVVLVVAWAVTLRPTQLGGPATMVVVTGDSMEPTLSDGDFVVLQEQASYDVGDIVTFPVPEGEAGAGALVIHRIVGAQGDKYVLRGDNRDRDDQWHPTAETVRGAYWFDVPGGGRFFMNFLQPPLIAALAGGGFTMWVLLRDTEATKKTKKKEADG